MKGRLTKRVFISADGTIASETDAYYSGHGFKDLDPDAGSPDWEKMIITYNYIAEKEGAEPWICELTNGPGKGRMSLKDAEALLGKWGVSRLGG